MHKCKSTTGFPEVVPQALDGDQLRVCVAFKSDGGVKDGIALL